MMVNHLDKLQRWKKRWFGFVSKQRLWRNLWENLSMFPLVELIVRTEKEIYDDTGTYKYGVKQKKISSFLSIKVVPKPLVMRYYKIDSFSLLKHGVPMTKEISFPDFLNFLPMFGFAVVNPMGPTFHSIGKLNSGDVIFICSLNPFTQSAKEITTYNSKY